MDTTNIWAILAEKIPDDKVQAVVDATNRTYGALSLNWEDVTFLFQIWNTHFAPANEPEDMNCKGCRTKVIGKFRNIVKYLEG